MEEDKEKLSSKEPKSSLNEKCLRFVSTGFHSSLLLERKEPPRSDSNKEAQQRACIQLTWILLLALAQNNVMQSWN